ncbi:MAG: hypothetical protein KAV00_00870 [Phycisphaerae bacterium]|nr:hypothetical protein [Phycisphaerae bacterium]
MDAKKAFHALPCWLTLLAGLRASLIVHYFVKINLSFRVILKRYNS